MAEENEVKTEEVAAEEVTPTGNGENGDKPRRGRPPKVKVEDILMEESPVVTVKETPATPTSVVIEDTPEVVVREVPPAPPRKLSAKTLAEQARGKKSLSPKDLTKLEQERGRKALASKQ